MRFALLTPMKGPDDPRPSGDRTFARLIRTALQGAGHEVTLPSGLVTWRAVPGDLDILLEAAGAEVERISASFLREGPPDAILTYHNYHKAPDLIGPALARRFALPYAIIEASRAPRRAHGPWARHFALADEALARADVVAAISAHDHLSLAEHLPERLVRFPPFIDADPFLRARAPRTGRRLVSAAMMRPGRKADSLRVLAKAYALVRAARADAELVVAGDGPARAELEPLFPAGSFAGLLARDELAAEFAAADIFVWPAIDEPFGFVFLEAQAAGLPVVAGRSGGVADAVSEGRSAHLTAPDDPQAIAEAILALLGDGRMRRAMGEAGRDFAKAHDLEAGIQRLDRLLSRAAAHAGTRRRVA